MDFNPAASLLCVFCRQSHKKLEEQVTIIRLGQQISQNGESYGNFRRKLRKTAYKDNEYMTDRIVLFTAKVTSGLKKGMEITAVQVIDSMYPVEQKQVRKGDRVLLAQNQYTQMSSVPYMFSEYYRLGFMAVFGGLYGILLILMGKSKGVNTVISLTLTVGAVFWVFVPAVLNGKNIYVWRRSVTLFIIVMTVMFINNLSDKTYTAAIGCVRGTAVTAQSPWGCALVCIFPV